MTRAHEAGLTTFSPTVIAAMLDLGTPEFQQLLRPAHGFWPAAPGIQNPSCSQLKKMSQRFSPEIFCSLTS